MDEILIRVTIEQKFHNHLIPKLGEIIFGGLIQNQTLLDKVLNTQFNVDDFIYFLVSKYNNKTTDLNLFIIDQLLIYLKLEDKQNES